MNTMDNGACDAFFGQQSLERKQAVTMLLTELDKAERKFPTWPDDLVHRAAIVSEEAGELVRASLQNQYEGDRLQELKKEATQTGAMSLMFLIKLPKRAFVILALLFSSCLPAPAQNCPVNISTPCHSLCVPGTFKVDTSFCGWFVMSGNGAQSYTWTGSNGANLVSPTFSVYPGNPGVITYTLTGSSTSSITGETCYGQAVISITNVICPNGVPQYVGVEEWASTPLSLTPVYFDVYGQPVSSLEEHKGQVLIEVVGKRRRKVVFE